MSTDVFDELTCPTCGGRIDGTGAKPCRCFAANVRPSRRTAVSDSLDDTLSDATISDATILPVGKPCRVCGKDLTGKPRLKDKLGYICKKCSDAEFKAEADLEASLIPCPECGRKLKPAGLVEYRGTLICKRCRADHDDTDKIKVGKVSLSKHREVERGNLMRLLIIAAALLAVAVYVTFLR